MPANRQSALDRLNAEERAFLGFRVSPDSHAPPVPAAPESGQLVVTPPSRRVGSVVAARGQSLRSVTLRLTPATAYALRRAAAARGVEYEEPFTQQSIAEAAIRLWLADRGHLPE